MKIVNITSVLDGVPLHPSPVKDLGLEAGTSPPPLPAVGKQTENITFPLFHTRVVINQHFPCDKETHLHVKINFHNFAFENISVTESNLVRV